MNAVQVMTPEAVVRMCRECALQVYATRPPTPGYARRVTRLLAGTAATETHLRAQRQGGFTLHTIRGAWGIFQTESGALEDSLKRMRGSLELRLNVERYVFRGEGRIGALYQLPTLHWLQLVHDFHRLACAFARMHYFRVPEPVPESDAAMAAYYKAHYNTVKGSGSVGKYLEDFELVRPALDALDADVVD